MLRIITRTAAVATIACLPFGAHALQFTVTDFARTALGPSQADYTAIRDANIVHVFATEDFEDFNTLGQIGVDASTVLSTDVGTFTTLGGKGSGTTAVDRNNTTVNNTERGRNLSIRQTGDGAADGGRQNTSFTTGDDDIYLDSNDTEGFKWVASAGGTAFDRLLFTLTDPADAGKTLTIKANGYQNTFELAAGQANGRIFNILIGFSTAVTSAELSLAKSGTNDGFSIDNITVGAVPLPAAAWLLLGVSGALVMGKRRAARKSV